MADETRQERILRRLKELGVNRGTASAIAKVMAEEMEPPRELGDWTPPPAELNAAGAMYTNATIGGQMFAEMRRTAGRRVPIEDDPAEGDDG